jgi:thiol:disulfide interchange protein DsbC
MLKKVFTGIAIVLITSSVYAFAVSNDAPQSATSAPAQVKPVLAAFDAEALKIKLSSKLGLVVEQVIATPMLGLAELVTDQGLFYASYDGNYLIQGKLLGLGQNITNLTEQSMAKVRVKGMEKFSDDMIVYPAKNEKHTITVFTDITCGYCRKLHEQMDDYNDKGITVRYLAYPRAGITDREGKLTQGYKDLRSVWCNEDPAMALTKAKSGSGIPARICEKPIKEEFDFGRRVGVTGTPAIMLANGMMLPGYRGPDDMISMLEKL